MPYEYIFILRHNFFPFLALRVDITFLPIIVVSGVVIVEAWVVKTLGVGGDIFEALSALWVVVPFVVMEAFSKTSGLLNCLMWLCPLSPSLHDKHFCNSNILESFWDPPISYFKFFSFSLRRCWSSLNWSFKCANSFHKFMLAFLCCTFSLVVTSSLIFISLFILAIDIDFMYNSSKVF